MDLPAFCRDEQLLSAPESEAMIDPEGTVAQRTAKVQERRHFECPKCTFGVYPILRTGVSARN